MTDSYISIDLETTGLNPKLDKIMEIGAVKVIGGQHQETFCTFINPGRKLEERIAQLTGIRQEQLEGAPSIEEALPCLLEFLGDLPLVGHRILFDYSFLKKAAANQKLSFEKEAIDTLKIARRFLMGLEHRTLGYLCKYYEIPHHAHRALDDAIAASSLYQILTRQFYEDEDNLFQPTKLVYKVKRDTPVTKAQKERLYRLAQQHKLILDVDVEKLTRSEASRITDKILSACGRITDTDPTNSL